MGNSERWASHQRAWRDPADVVAGWPQSAPDPSLLASETDGPWWELIESLGITLLVSREYEHFLLGLTVAEGRPQVTFQPLPHPSGITIDPAGSRVYVAATRNPNQLVSFLPFDGLRPRSDWGGVGAAPAGRPLLPERSLFLPGSVYLHDLAFIGGELHANAVGENAVVKFAGDGRWERVWWPRSIEGEAGPDFQRNTLQLNSIAAGPSLAGSFFSASAAVPGERLPGDPSMPVDGRGVIFGGASREPVVSGLTRPHSARLQDGRLWVANSGYGEVCLVQDGALQSVATLPGWTRGLAFQGDILFVATSRVLPRFEAYAPGLDPDASRCGLHALDYRHGRRLASLYWPAGNQVFAVTVVPRTVTAGWPFRLNEKDAVAVRRLFYAFSPPGENEE